MISQHLILVFVLFELVWCLWLRAITTNCFAQTLCSFFLGDCIKVFLFVSSRFHSYFLFRLHFADAYNLAAAFEFVCVCVCALHDATGSMKKLTRTDTYECIHITHYTYEGKPVFLETFNRCSVFLHWKCYMFFCIRSVHIFRTCRLNHSYLCPMGKHHAVVVFSLLFVILSDAHAVAGELMHVLREIAWCCYCRHPRRCLYRCCSYFIITWPLTCEQCEATTPANIF